MLKFTLKKWTKLDVHTRFGLVFSTNIYPLTIAVRYPNKMIASHSVSRFCLYHSLFISEEMEECFFSVRC